MAGRFLLGFGVAICATAGPSYVSEMAHPAYRGAMTGLYNVLWFGGGIPGTFIPWKTSQIQSEQSWRIPIWLQMVFAGCVLLFCFTLPEVRLCFTPIWNGWLMQGSHLVGSFLRISMKKLSKSWPNIMVKETEIRPSCGSSTSR